MLAKLLYCEHGEDFNIYLVRSVAAYKQGICYSFEFSDGSFLIVIGTWAYAYMGDKLENLTECPYWEMTDESNT